MSLLCSKRELVVKPRRRVHWTLNCNCSLNSHFYMNKGKHLHSLLWLKFIPVHNTKCRKSKPDTQSVTDKLVLPLPCWKFVDREASTCNLLPWLQNSLQTSTMSHISHWKKVWHDLWYVHTQNPPVCMQPMHIWTVSLSLSAIMYMHTW